MNKWIDVKQIDVLMNKKEWMNKGRKTERKKEICYDVNVFLSWIHRMASCMFLEWV